jgi:hypothetical protein
VFAAACFFRRIRLFGLLLAMTLVADASARAAGPSLPRDLGPAERARLEPIANAATITTRWEAEGFPARLTVFEYLLDHPELTSHVTRAVKAGRYKIWRTRDGLHLDDGWGAKGRLEVVHAARGVRVMYARGEFEHKYLPNIPGEAIVIVEYAVVPTPGAASPHRITPTVSGFVKIDGRVYTAASRMASSAVREKADKESQRLAKTLRRVSKAIEDNPAHVFDLLRQRTDVPARELEEFRKLLNLPRTATP